MDALAPSSPYTPIGAGPTSVSGNPPVLGSQVPGYTGGLPTQGGLSVLANPMAEQLRSQGRGEDTMLVHMTPDEVNSLQGLAMAHGGSLTVNPETGLPEAGFLGKILPMLLGVGLNFLLPGSGLVASLGGKAATAGLLTAAGTTAVTGDLQKGLMAGLGAFGGASLAGGIQGALGGAAKAGTSAIPNAGEIVVTHGQGVVPAATGSAAPTMVKGLGGFTQGFANTAKGTLGGMLGKAAVPAAIMGVTGNVSNAMTPTVKTAEQQTDNSYAGPYYAQQRDATFAPDTRDLLASSKERDYFAVDVPEIRNTMGQLVQPGSSTAPGTPILQNVLSPDIVKKGFLGLGTKTVKNANKYTQQWVPFMGEQGIGYAGGGVVDMEPGSFVYSARETAEHGGGDTLAGQKELAKLGGIPIRGPGDGTSDSIKASIGGRQEARLASGEVLFPPEAVKRIGGGSAKRGTQKLYAMMHKAEQSRKKAPRGADANLRKGLV